MATEEELGTLLVGISLDGSGFQNGVSIINREMRVLTSEYKKAEAQIGEFGNATDKFKLQSEMLGQQIELQKNKVNVLQVAYDRMVEAKGADARATQELAIKLNRAQTELSGMENKLTATKNALVDAELNLAGVSDAVDALNRQMRIAQTEFQATAAEIGAAGDEEELFKAKVGSLNGQIDIQRQKVETLQDAFERAAQAKGRDAKATQNLQVELNQARAGLSSLERDLKNTEDAWNNLANGVQQAGSEVDNAGGVMGRAGAFIQDTMRNAALAIGAAFTAAAAAATMAVAEIDKTFDKLAASTGAGADQAAQLESSVRAAYSQGYGESIEQAATAAGLLEQQLNLSGEAADKALKNALTIQEVFNNAAADRQAAAVRSMTEAFAGMSETEAFDVITVGFQNGVDKSGDFLDSLEEYSIKFNQLGLSAAEMTTMMGVGLDNGARNADIVADTVKEFQISVTDGSKTTSDAFKALGFNADEMRMRFIAGGEGAREGFYQILDALKNVDAKTREDAALALFKTKWEDATEKVVLSLSNVQNEIFATDGATARAAQTMHDNLATKFTQIGRQIKLAFAGDNEIGAVMNDAADSILASMPQIQAVIKSALDAVGETFRFVADHADGLTAAFAGFAAAFTAAKIAGGIAAMQAAGGAVAALKAAWVALNSTMLLNPWVLAIGAIVAAGVLIYKNWDEISAFLKDTWTKLTTTLSATWDGVKAYFTNLWGGIKVSASAAWQGIQDALASAWAAIQPVLDVIGAAYDAFWSSIWTVASAYIATVTAVFSALWESVKVIFSAALLVVYNLVTGRWDEIGTVFSSASEKLRGIVGDLWEQVKAIWTGAFEAIWNNTQIILTYVMVFIKNAIIKARDIWTETVQGIKNAWFDLWANVKTAAANGWQAVYNFFATVPERISTYMTALKHRIALAWIELNRNALQAGKDFLTGFVNGVMDMAAWVRRKIAGFFDDVVGWAKEVLDIHSPSRVMQEIGQWTMEGFVVGMEDKESRAYKVVEAIGEGVQKALSSINLDMDITNTEYQIAMAVNGADEVERLNTQLELLEMSLDASDDRLAVLNKGFNDSAAVLGMYADESRKLYLEILKEQQAQIDLKKQVTQAIGDSAQRALSAINLDMSITDLEYEIAMSATGVAEVERLKLEVESLNLAIGASDDRLATLNKAYNDTVYLLGENAEESKKLYVEILKEQKVRADLKKQVEQTNRSIIDQQEQMSKAQKQVAEETKRYLDEMAKAQEDYEKKVQATRDSEAEGIRKLNEEYDKAFEARRSSLVNFVGLFDKVQSKNVDGSQLLDNLRGQVDTFIDWQKNLDGLKNRKIDANLLGELTQMGPKSAAEIAALNGLSDADLQEYVRLWKEKNKLASQQATAELSGMKEETRKKIDELKKVTAAKLDEIRAEWKSKNEKIRADTVANFDKMKQDAQKFGGDFISKITTSINESMPMLEQTLADIRAKIQSALSVTGSTIGVIGGAVGAAIKVPGLVTGGTITRAGLTLVGEKGPELLNLPSAASVVPLDGSVGGLGGTTIEIHVNGTVYGVDDLSGLMTQAIKKTPLAPILDNQMRQGVRKNY